MVVDIIDMITTRVPKRAGIHMFPIFCRGLYIAHRQRGYGWCALEMSTYCHTKYMPDASQRSNAPPSTTTLATACPSQSTEDHLTIITLSAVLSAPFNQPPHTANAPSPSCPRHRGTRKHRPRPIRSSPSVVPEKGREEGPACPGSPLQEAERPTDPPSCRNSAA